jgi:ATP-dependent RNA helicase DeaD
MTTDPAAAPTFAELDLPAPIVQAVRDLGYETPSPIQARIIPHLLAGSNVLGQAQTGTGKTAAFALPLLARLDPSARHTQVLVLAPTRELAIQVAQAFERYGAQLPQLSVLALYGGQGYREQLIGLRRGAQVVVGTPGRVMDHMRRGTLDLSALSALVLDEADEMLRMGFIDDVEWILSETPEQRQLALFSATLPAPIKRIAQQHLRDAQEVSIKVRTTTAETIRQRYWRVSGVPKRAALTRILETTPHEGVLIFVRTKLETQELADHLVAQGHTAAPLSGDIAQAQREHTVNRLKSGQLDLVVATDVAARGLDVDRISHVINYDIPYDTEAYVHRIGRTGRAGRSGEAILFVMPREQRMLQAIERATRQRIEEMTLPSIDDVNRRRVERFGERLDAVLADPQRADVVTQFRQLLEDYANERGHELLDVAAALAALLQGGEPLFLRPERVPPRRDAAALGERPARARREPGERAPRGRDGDQQLESYRVEVGRSHGVRPSNLVGAIANEINLDSKYIGRIEIHDEYSVIDLPVGLPRDLQAILRRVRVAGQPLDIRPLRQGGGGDRPVKPRPTKRPPSKPTKARTGYPKRRAGEG